MSVRWKRKDRQSSDSEECKANFKKLDDIRQLDNDAVIFLIPSFKRPPAKESALLSNS